MRAATAGFFQLTPETKVFWFFSSEKNILCLRPASAECAVSSPIVFQPIERQPDYAPAPIVLAASEPELSVED
jgi:hypothetical protein